MPGARYDKDDKRKKKDLQLKVVIMQMRAAGMSVPVIAKTISKTEDFVLTVIAKENEKEERKKSQPKTPLTLALESKGNDNTEQTIAPRDAVLNGFTKLLPQAIAAVEEAVNDTDDPRLRLQAAQIIIEESTGRSEAKLGLGHLSDFGIKTLIDKLNNLDNLVKERVHEKNVTSINIEGEVLSEEDEENAVDMLAD